jgi:queuosine biosynthesis protein QueD
MISVTKIFTFEAAHYLEDYPGKCATMHGHSYKLEIEVAGDGVGDNWMVVDFGDLKKVVNEEVVDKLDHKCLNEVLVNAADQPVVATAENMCVWIAMKLKPEIELPEDPLRRTLVRCATGQDIIKIVVMDDEQMDRAVEIIEGFAGMLWKQCPPQFAISLGVDEAGCTAPSAAKKWIRNFFKGI